MQVMFSSECTGSAFLKFHRLGMVNEVQRVAGESPLRFELHPERQASSNFRNGGSEAEDSHNI